MNIHLNYKFIFSLTFSFSFADNYHIDYKRQKYHAFLLLEILIPNLLSYPWKLNIFLLWNWIIYYYILCTEISEIIKDVTINKKNTPPPPIKMNIKTFNESNIIGGVVWILPLVRTLQVTMFSKVFNSEYQNEYIFIL